MKLSSLKIIADEALKTIAQAQGAKVEEVKLAIDSGNEIACRQFQKLVLLGLQVAAE